MQTAQTRPTTPAATSESTVRRAGDGELILRLAARRLEDLGLMVRASMLRGGIADRAALSLRAEAAYDLARRQMPDSDRAALLRATALYIAHFYAQGL